jgi:poly(3-hydroxybutyrate) depolymerase
MRRLCVAVVAFLVTGGLPLATAARAQVPDGDPTDLPVLSAETPSGTGTTVDVAGPAPVTKTADGDTSDWIGAPSRYGGTALYSAGELVYQDHLFDAYGPDDGRDAQRLGLTDGLEETAPDTYRIDALAQADAAGELGVPVPDQLATNASYGDADHQDGSDLAELRAAISGDDLALLARTTTMTSAADTALLVLADTIPGSTPREVPFDSGITTAVGDVALFISNGDVLVADLTTGTSPTSATGASAVASPNGWDNALEATVPLADVTGSDGTLSLAVATGKPNASGTGFAHLAIEQNDDQPHANLANVAFRLDEPVRYWFEKKQAMALYSGSVDPFFLTLDEGKMRAGASQEYVPGYGYHDRIFLSDPATGVPREGGRDGIFQHYGLFLPHAYDGTPAPLQWWLHWRGGDAHSGAAVVPKVFSQLGEDEDSIVVAPSGRGTSTWYVGRGHVDFLEVWRDVFDTVSIDRDRVYVTGHSMGGWGSYLMTILYPDRFAAAAPASGPVTMGAWTGLDFPGCDSFKYEEYTPCYIDANGSRPRDQLTRKLLDNARHVPYAIMHGTDDELVPYSGVLRQAERLTTLGYRYRLYTFPGWEHYSPPAVDQWAELGTYMHKFTRPENPAQVTYKRDMPFERATEEVQSGGANLNFDFNSAYWMSELTPVDPINGVASFDGRSLAIPEQPHITAPDTGPPTAPGQTGPYVITGLQWVYDPSQGPAPTSNAFAMTLTGASAVRLDLGRMDIAASKTVAGTVTTGAPLDLRLGRRGDARRVHRFLRARRAVLGCGDARGSIDRGERGGPCKRGAVLLAGLVARHRCHRRQRVRARGPAGTGRSRRLRGRGELRGPLRRARPRHRLGAVRDLERGLRAGARGQWGEGRPQGHRDLDGPRLRRTPRGPGDRVLRERQRHWDQDDRLGRPGHPRRAGGLLGQGRELHRDVRRQRLLQRVVGLEDLKPNLSRRTAGSRASTRRLGPVPLPGRSAPAA